MTETATRRTRADIDDAHKWNLADIYPDWSAWEKALTTLEQGIGEYAALKGTLGKGADALLRAYELNDRLGQLAYTSVIKRDLSGMGRWLFAGMIAILIAAVVNIFIGSSAMMLALTALSTLVFSLYMLYDVKNIVDGGETNYIVAATQLFIDIFAVFQNLLALFGIMGGDD